VREEWRVRTALAWAPMLRIRMPRTGFGVAEILGLGPAGDPARAAALRDALTRLAVFSVQHRAGGNFRLGEPRRF